MTTTEAAFDEGARWCRVHAEAWVFFPALGTFTGMAFHRGPELAWCAHCAGMVHTGLGFVDAVAIVEQAALNDLDATTDALKL
jgi:hypothetical protein